MTAALDLFSERILEGAGLELTQTIEHADAEELHDLVWTAYALGWADALLSRKHEA